MFRKPSWVVLALVMGLTILAGLTLYSPASGGDKCLVLHSVMVNGNDPDSPRAGDRDKDEYMLTQDFCISDEFGGHELTGRALTAMEGPGGWGMSTTMRHSDPEHIERNAFCEAVWDIAIAGSNPENPGVYHISGIVYILDFKKDRIIAKGREKSFFNLPIELDKEILIPFGPMGTHDNVSLALKLTKDDSEK